MGIRTLSRQVGPSRDISSLLATPAFMGHLPCWRPPAARLTARDPAVQAREQLPGFGFELAQEGEVTFGVTVCHGLLRFVRNPAGGRPALQGLLEDTASRPMARARFTAS